MTLIELTVLLEANHFLSTLVEDLYQKYFVDNILLLIRKIKFIK
jgi:hypothetical protein